MVHIVYMGDQLKDVSSVKSLHIDLLDQVVGSGASERLVHSYKRSFNGFAAQLSDEEVEKIASMNEVVSVIPNKRRELHTTKSWDFTGFPVKANREPFERDVIIGMLDTGIWPESESFNNEGIGPPPQKWKGTCQSLFNFTCNNKIIGAKYYRSEGKLKEGDIDSPRDSAGHGSHTASIAAGRQVHDASLHGLAKGTARGGAPAARIAVYKICWLEGCYDADILAAFDDAIADGVDIISLSVGGTDVEDYFEDASSIGAFHAMKNGILTSCSGGNSGPMFSTIENFSPWILTVAANTIDRQFLAEVRLGNGNRYEGLAINTFGFKNTMHPLVYAGDVPNISAGFNGSTSRYCYNGSLEKNLVKGKIVLCDTLNDASGLSLDGAAGAVMQSEFLDVAYPFPLPVTVLGLLDARKVSQYISKASHPKANILKSRVFDDPAAPYPDLSAPGVDILAAWSPISSPPASYNIISGTSMACPHATGAAAYVKSFHPTWSPAAIKSALMTTAYPMKESKNIDAELAYGAGQINPTRALNPGLVYDAGEADYISMLCGQGYSTKKLRLVTGDNSRCSATNNGTVFDLNYPSFALSVESGKLFSASFRRTITNVGLPKSMYRATVRNAGKLKIHVEPRLFSFKSLMEKQSFVLKVKGGTARAIVSASLELSDGVHHVRSPIVVYTVGVTKP
ncbi:uncharacterized protein A4U43_C07F820 [Asparagus officinalis]|uniref:Uncharacterized protein n=1 Tax=Asparagus officinalis TaxID=4686 RepID=A0A5P1E8K2_ASPOF|nr:uncharacterized protein A4U43_C07F820 [Asparagus officinalis]